MQTTILRSLGDISPAFLRQCWQRLRVHVPELENHSRRSASRLRAAKRIERYTATEAKRLGCPRTGDELVASMNARQDAMKAAALVYEVEEEHREVTEGLRLVRSLCPSIRPAPAPGTPSVRLPARRPLPRERSQPAGNQRAAPSDSQPAAATAVAPSGAPAADPGDPERPGVRSCRPGRGERIRFGPHGGPSCQSNLAVPATPLSFGDLPAALDDEDVARVLRCSRRTAQRLMSAGKLGPVSDLGRRRVRRDHFVAALSGVKCRRAGR